MQSHSIAWSRLTIIFGAGLLILAVIILMLLMKMYRLRKLKLRLEESSGCRNQIIDEYSGIRHEYNNILQTVTNLVEAEDMEELAQYKRIMLDKVHSLSRSSITQLGKIKADTVLNPIHQLYNKAIKENIELNINVYHVIKRECPCEEELYLILNECLKSALCMLSPVQPAVNLGIRESEHGLSFHFECRTTQEAGGAVKTPVYKDAKLRKLFSYNIFLKDNTYVQEIMIKLS